mmetsp:Transcript_65522/g.76225  ORF Transcript_65522/g.76225 Transcript_65522/m.76225 type:complete len:94 (+) Transcript_65522:3-284(+)
MRCTLHITVHCRSTNPSAHNMSGPSRSRATVAVKRERANVAAAFAERDDTVRFPSLDKGESIRELRSVNKRWFMCSAAGSFAFEVFEEVDTST